MPLKTILVPVTGEASNEPVPVTGEASNEPALRLAIELTRKFQAMLIGLHVREDPLASIHALGNGIAAGFIEDRLQAIERAGLAGADAAKKLFSAACAVAGLPMGGKSRPRAEWRLVLGPANETIASAARLADLTVVNQPKAGDEDSLGILDGLLLSSGKPVLMAPLTTPAIPGETVMIAWNGSAEASRAVAAALPFLSLARRVVIIGIGVYDEIGSKTSALADYLRDNDIACEEFDLSKQDEPTGKMLLDFGAEIHADLLVMGAYTHNRLRQIIFGGVTHYILKNAAMPVLMSH